MATNGSDLRASVLSQLRGHILSAKTSLAIRYFLLNSAVYSAVSGALDSDSRKADRLAPDGDLGKAVLSGALSHEKWAGIARTTWEDVEAQTKIVGGAMPSFSRVWEEIVTPTGATIVNVAEDIKEGTTSYLPYLLALAGLIAVAVITGNARAIIGK